MQEWLEYSELEEKENPKEKRSSNRQPEENRWKNPGEGWSKVNTDAVVDTKRQRAGWGIVGRDNKGKLVAVWVRK